MPFQSGEHSFKVQDMLFKSFGEDYQIVDICPAILSMLSGDPVNHSLNVGWRVTVAHYGHLEALLTTM